MINYQLAGRGATSFASTNKRYCLKRCFPSCEGARYCASTGKKRNASTVHNLSNSH